eukprot:s777_g52.t1
MAEEDIAGFIADFRGAVRTVSRSSERECLVVCYTREVLGQTGAGYDEETDSILIMDVARSRFTVSDSIPALALQTDPLTGKPRGYLHVHLQMRSALQGAPFRVPFVPPAAGRRLSEALAAKLADIDSATGDQCPLPTSDTPHLVVMRRWLSAVAAVEPQVWGQLLQIGDLEAVQEVFARLASYQPFMDLCKAYDEATQHFCGAEFPPLRFQASQLSTRRQNGNSAELALWSCGELWVLLLLLLPEHLQVLVSPELASAGLAKAGTNGPEWAWASTTICDFVILQNYIGVARAIRGPWALPLEAQRETLSHILPVKNVGDHIFKLTGVLEFEGVPEEKVFEVSMEAEADVEDIITREDGVVEAGLGSAHDQP